MGHAYVVGTFDTKGDELGYVADLVRRTGATVTTVDVGTADSGAASAADVGARDVAGHHPDGVDAVFTGDRGRSVSAMAEALARFLPGRSDLDGVLGLGGSGGTALITPAMRALPVGVPKVMVSTVASGDVTAYVGPSDLIMMPSVTDVAGLNRISRRVLGNAAHALAGAIASTPPPATDLPALGLTMFGVTTPCVTAVTAALADRWDCLVFHATGTGGRAMEKLVDDGLVEAVVDVSTTEIADLVVGGVMAATEDRLGAIVRTGVPWVGSVGALDMVNFGAPDTVPERFRGRTLYEHNAQVTLMRTTPDECRAAAEFLARRLNASPGPVRLLLPTGGVSALDTPGGPFADPRRRRRAVLDVAGEGPRHRRPPDRREPAPRQRPGIRGRPGGRPLRDHRRSRMTPTRREILDRLHQKVERGEPIVGGGAGTGLSARCEEAGGIDLIVIYNSGRYRMAGRGSLAGLLAYGNANDIVLEMAREVLPVVRHTPVLAGVNATDPFLILPRFLRELRELGFAGVQNFPTVGIIDGTFRANLEETGMGYEHEVALVAAAREADLLTTPYVFGPDEARAMTDAGADIVVCHMGLTTGGGIGAVTAKSLDDCVALVDEWSAAAREVRDDVLVLVHGGPVSSPQDAEYVLSRTRRCHGFYGASSMERLPTEQALTETTRAFTAIRPTPEESS